MSTWNNQQPPVAGRLYPKQRLSCYFRQTALLNAIMQCYYKMRSRHTSKQNYFIRFMLHLIWQNTMIYKYKFKLIVQNRRMTSSMASSYAVLISPLVLCFAFECIGALASPPDFVLISLGHWGLSTGRSLDFTTLWPSSIYPRALEVCTWLVNPIALKQSFLPLFPAILIKRVKELAKKLITYSLLHYAKPSFL